MLCTVYAYFEFFSRTRRNVILWTVWNYWWKWVNHLIWDYTGPVQFQKEVLWIGQDFYVLLYVWNIYLKKKTLPLKESHRGTSWTVRGKRCRKKCVILHSCTCNKIQKIELVGSLMNTAEQFEMAFCVILSTSLLWLLLTNAASQILIRQLKPLLHLQYLHTIIHTDQWEKINAKCLQTHFAVSGWSRCSNKQINALNLQLDFQMFFNSALSKRV